MNLSGHQHRSARVKRLLDAFQAKLDRAMEADSASADIDAALDAGHRAFNAWRKADRLHPHPLPDSAEVIDDAERECAGLLTKRRIELFAADRGVTMDEIVSAIHRRLGDLN